jgi:hypothetical protein
MFSNQGLMRKAKNWTALISNELCKSYEMNRNKILCSFTYLENQMFQFWTLKIIEKKQLYVYIGLLLGVSTQNEAV